MTLKFESLNLAIYSKSDQKLIGQAFKFAEKAHDGQNRLSGEPYFSHPIEVAKILIDLGLDASTIAAALLHDVPEDTACTSADLKKEFGIEIAGLVDGVTRLGKIRMKKDWQKNAAAAEDSFYSFPRQMETLRKMFVAMASDIRVVLIKLADRLHNMRTISYLPAAKQLRIAKETLEIIAPLADRLGMGIIKGELEDLAFPIAYPKEYKKVANKFGKDYEFRKNYVEKMKKYLTDKLAEVGVESEIHGRAKHFYSLHKKLSKYIGQGGRIYDLVAMRIVVDNLKDCYAVLGYIHQLFKPLPTKIKDYIAMPKPNGYQSIHTTIFGLEGQIIEIQIRTREMHDYAEYGVAAHWHYGEKIGPKEEAEKKGIFAPKKEMAWAKELAGLQESAKNRKDLNDLKTDFFAGRIFVFTPTGDICDLPVGATPVDFAYRIHTELGNRCGGAKVNGKMVVLSQSLQSGDIVEIIERKKSTGPKRDWLKFVKTSAAKAHIRQELRQT